MCAQWRQVDWAIPGGVAVRDYTELPLWPDMFVTGEKFSLTNINRIFFLILDIRLPSKYNIKWLTVVVGLRQMLCCFRKKKKKEKGCAEVLRICLRYARWCRLDEGFWGEEISWGKLGVRMCRCRVGRRGAYAVRSKTIHLGTYPI